MFYYNKRIPRFFKLPSAITDCFHRSNGVAEAKIPRLAFLQEFRKLALAKKTTHVYADTCTLLHDSGLELLDAADMVFSATPNQHLLILTSVLYELQNVGQKNPSKIGRCTMVIDKLKYMNLNGSVKFIRSSSPDFSDAGFISQFITETQSYEVVLLTQDKSLAQKATHLPSFLDGCINCTHSIRVFRLTTDGNLVPFVYNENQREVDYHEKLNVHQPAFHSFHEDRAPAPYNREKYHAGVYSSYPKFHASSFTPAKYPRRSGG